MESFCLYQLDQLYLLLLAIFFFFVIKPTDQQVTNSETLIDDTAYDFTPTINKTYAYMLIMYVNSHTNQDIKIKWSLPTGATQEINTGNLGATPNVMNTNGSTDGTTTGFDMVAVAMGRIVMAGNAGDAILQWAQNNAGANDTKMLLGGTLSVWEI